MAMAKKQLYSREELNKMTKKAKFHYENVIIPEKENEVKEGTEKFQNIIKGRDAFLKHFVDKNKYKFTIAYKGYEIPIEIRPIQPGDDLSILGHKPEDIYPDLSPDELYLVQKANNGEYLSENEQEQLKGLILEPDQQSISKSSQNNMFKALAQNVVDPQLTEDEWFDMHDFGLKAYIYAELQERLGLSPNLQITILP